MATQEAQKYISRKIAYLRNEGVPEKQSVAIAFNMARERGFKVPPTPGHIRRAEKMG